MRSRVCVYAFLQKGKESYRFQVSLCFVNHQSTSIKGKRKLPLSTVPSLPILLFRQSKEESYRFKYSSLSVHANQREKKATALTIPSFRYSCCFVNQRKKESYRFQLFFNNNVILWFDQSFQTSLCSFSNFVCQLHIFLI